MRRVAAAATFFAVSAATRSRPLRLGLLGLGWVLVALSPVLAPVPGPGGVFVFAAGASLVLRNSTWAKRRYARAERRWPRLAAWANWALRRPSAARRAEREKARAD